MSTDYETCDNDEESIGTVVKSKQKPVTTTKKVHMWPHMHIGTVVKSKQKHKNQYPI